MSDEVMDHVRRYDYDGQGKGFAQETTDSMWIVAFAVLGFGIVMVFVAVLVIIKA